MNGNSSGSRTGFQPGTGIAPGTGLHYLHAGAGDPVILLHGWGASKEIWWGTLKALAPAYSTFAFDWPGHGSPALDADRDVLAALVEVTAATCSALGLERITLAGHSLGGNVAVRVAIAYPDLVANLILVNAAVDAEHLSKPSRLLADPRWGETVLRLERRLTRPFARFGARVPHEHAGGSFRAWTRRTGYMARVDTRVLHSFLVALHQGSLGEQVHAIKQPTLIVTGKRDPLVQPRQAYQLARTIPDAELAIIDGAYHVPMDERPAELHRTLLAFLEEHPPRRD